MKRRDLLSSLAIAPFLRNTSTSTLSERGTFAIDANRVRFFNAAVREHFSILFVADTHLFIDDARGEPYQQYSGRMAKAYNQTKHFQTGEATNPAECFQQTLAIAKNEGVSLIALIGDILSFPSEAGVEWVSQQLKTTYLPYVYVAGNHDWHYEGMSGTVTELRDTWTKKRLSPLYQGENPLMTVREINGVRFVVIDNSIYEILPEQLAFFRKEVTTGKPLALFVHIPLYAPERSLGFGCGHPDWNAKNDKNYQLERRPQWPEAGHNEVTKTFYKEVMNAPNLLGIFAGHTHKQTLDVMNGLPQIVTNPNFTGAYLKVEFIPQKV